VIKASTYICYGLGTAAIRRLPQPPLQLPNTIQILAETNGPNDFAGRCTQRSSGEYETNQISKHSCEQGLNSDANHCKNQNLLYRLNEINKGRKLLIFIFLIPNI
jgi:hypothetical protein